MQRASRYCARGGGWLRCRRALPPPPALLGRKSSRKAQPSQADTRPSCISVFASSLFGQPVTEQALAQGAKVGSQAFAAASLRYQMENLLVVPLRSVYVRGMNAVADILGITAEASPYLFAASAIIPAEVHSIAANLTGTCQNNFWSSIF